MTATGRQQQQCLSRADKIFLERMRAECEELEAYRLQVMRRDDRELSLDQAAREWIERYAQTH